MVKSLLGWDRKDDAEKARLRRSYYAFRRLGHHLGVGDRELSRLEAWHQTLLSFAEGNAPDGVALPSFPSAETQAAFVGASFEDALYEAYQFYRVVLQYSRSLGTPLRSPSARFLDFGCGWGRFLRYAMMDFAKERLFAVDVDSDIIDVCRATGVPATFDVIAPDGALPYADNSLSHVIAYSVFTHLPEAVHKRWISEIERVIRPGGVFVATLEPRRFLNFVRSFSDERNIKSTWHQSLSEFSTKADDCLAAYDRGEFVYLPTGGGKFRPQDVYGEAIVPVSYVKANWRNLNVKALVDDGESYQTIVVAQKSG
jgi:SAM-dependent methyltransferase